MKFRHGGLALAGAAALCAAGCRTAKDILDDYEANLSAGNYGALAPESAEMAAKKDGSELMWRLLAGSGHWLSMDPAGAARHFDAAEDAMAANDAKSVFAQTGDGALAMMTNDKAFPYDGGGQDRIFTCLYKAIDFMSAGNLQGARTELNRAGQHQDNWIHQRRKDVEAAGERLEREADEYVAQQKAAPQGDRSEQTGAALADASFASALKEKCGYDPAVSGNLETLKASDYVNAYALHVAGVFRTLSGDGGNTLLRDAAALVSQGAPQRDWADAQKGAKPAGQVWIWAEDGLCPVREEWRVDLPLICLPYAGRYVLYAGMALPYLRERPAAADAWSVKAGAETAAMTLLEDMDALLKTEYDVYMRGALAREVTRTVVRTGVQIALGAAAENTNNSDHSLVLRLAQIGAAGWAAAATAADLRCWSALPKRVWCARVARPADGVIEVAAGPQTMRFTVPEGNTMLFVRKPSAAAAPVAKQVTFAAR